eukprot:scaffold45578_cov41-Cyclotella_meneghiniana.AAC.2
MLLGPVAGRISASGRVNMTRLLILAVLAVVIGADSIAVRQAEATRNPLALESCLELGKLLGVGGGAGGWSAGVLELGLLAARVARRDSMLAIFLAVASVRVLLVASGEGKSIHAAGELLLE